MNTMTDGSVMSSKVDPGDPIEDLSSVELLRDIEDISRALYLHKTPPKDLLSSLGNHSKSLNIASGDIIQKSLRKEKKPSIWNWKPLKALTNIGSHRFNCCFFLHVHVIEGLPSAFNDLSLCVNWRRKDEVMRTRPVRVCQGMVEIEETLTHHCSVNGNRSGPENSAKYEPKLFLLDVSLIGARGLDIGKHWVDLTRLLPLTLEELEEEKRTSGKWTTSFKLTGKAKGATLHVSFGYSLLWGNTVDPYSFLDNLKGSGPTAIDNLVFEDRDRMTSGMFLRLDSIPRNSSILCSVTPRSVDIRTIEGAFRRGGSPFAHSISFLYRKLEEERLANSDEFDFFRGYKEPLKSKSENANFRSNILNCNEFTVSETQTKLDLEEERKLEDDNSPNPDHPVVETIDISEIFKDIEDAGDSTSEFPSRLQAHDNNCDGGLVEENKHEESDLYSEKSIMEEFESDFHHLLTSGSAALGSSLDIGDFDVHERRVKRTSSLRKGVVRSVSLDDLTESVANDFLNMLGIDQEETSENGPESPRERLLRQFEEESLALGNSIFCSEATETEQIEFNDVAATSHGRVACSDDFDLSLAIAKVDEQANKGRLEKLDFEALTKQWDLDQNDFHYSPSISSGGFGSPIR